MARTVDLRRHTDNDGDALTPTGVAAAMALGEQLAEPIAFAASTGAQRATQTIACALAASPVRLLCGVIVHAGLRSSDEDRWKRAVSAAGSGRLSAVREVDADWVDAEAERLGAALRGVFDDLADGHRALVVGHSPTNEAAVLGLTGHEPEPLGKGAGLRLVEDHGTFHVEPLAAASFELRGH